jgi:hypothetical protein
MIFMVEIKITKVAAGFADRPLNGKRVVFGRTERKYTSAGRGFIAGGHFDGKGICMREFALKRYASAARKPYWALHI